MDSFIQRVIEGFHLRILQSMPPERRIRKLPIVNSLTRKAKKTDKPEAVLNNVKALTFKSTDEKDCKLPAKTPEVELDGSVFEDGATLCSETDSRTGSCHGFDTNLLEIPSFSTPNLLEEIEADLPSPYSLANVLDHTFHTVNNVRTFARLSRVCTNLVPSEEDVKIIQTPECDSSSRLQYLQREAFIQKTVVEQAEKAVSLCRARKKYLDSEDVESLRILLLAKLRYELINLELQNIKLFGTEADDEKSGEVSVTDIHFTVKDFQYFDPGHFLCVAFERENLQFSQVKSDIINRKLHFSVDFKFRNLDENFIIDVELYHLNFNEKGKKDVSKKSAMKHLLKMAANGKSKNDTSGDGEHCFSCIGSASVRLEDVRQGKMGKVLVEFHSGYDNAFVRTIVLHLKTSVSLNSTINGFLNVFKDQCWHRLWCCQVENSLLFWKYPEDKDNEKPPSKEIVLATCQDVQPVSMEVCVRPHSFLITFNNSESSLLLSASSHKDMMNWVNHLKTAAQCFQTWKCDS